MGFTIERVSKVTFEPCIGWPKPVDWNIVPDYTEVCPVINGHFNSTMFGEMILDNFTGYVRIEFSQERCTGDSEDRIESRKVAQENKKIILDALNNFR